MPRKKASTSKTKPSGTAQQTPVPLPNSVFEQAAFMATKKRWLWVGVISFMTMIGLLWGWSLKLQIGSYHYSGSAEQHLIDENKQNWETAFKTAEPPAPTETPEQKIKETIAVIMANTSSTKNISSSTVVVSTTK